LPLDFTPSGGHKDKQEIYHKERKRWERRTKSGGVYPKEFKAEAVALAGKRQKPICHVAADLGINENRHHRWIQQFREGSGLPPFSGHEKPRDERNWPGCGKR
jgi:transposase-like protein